MSAQNITNCKVIPHKVIYEEKHRMSALVGLSDRSCDPKLNLDVICYFLLLSTGKNRWNI